MLVSGPLPASIQVSQRRPHKKASGHLAAGDRTKMVLHIRLGSLEVVDCIDCLGLAAEVVFGAQQEGEDCGYRTFSVLLR